MAQQTAVEWYAKEHHKLLIQLENKELSLGAYVVKHSDILKQAKQIEKEQIIKAYKKESAYMKHAGCSDKQINESAKKYYNETYGIK